MAANVDHPRTLALGKPRGRSVAASSFFRAGLFACSVLLLGGCRGNRSEQPPVHLNPNMDNVARYDPQEPSPFHRDERAMRPEVPGTVARGSLKNDVHLHRGKGPDGQPASTLPMELSRELLARGRTRYDIYCTPCHGGAGVGDGIVVKKGLLPPPSFHDDRIRAMPVGQIFDVITRGVRNMQPYSAQIPAKDRWAIVGYVRALQAARTASIRDVPADIAASKGWNKP
jgi:mono/diheme cytochrome c family protein